MALLLPLGVFVQQPLLKLPPGDRDLAVLAVLTDPQRRRVFDHVRAVPDSTVSQIAEALGVGRTLLTFHLGKLADAGLVEVGAAQRLLTALGYAPARHDATVVVRNCPFDKLRREHTERVCAVNLALAEGYVEGLDLTGQVEPRLRPCPDGCCVVFEATGT